MTNNEQVSFEAHMLPDSKPNGYFRTHLSPKISNGLPCSANEIEGRTCLNTHKNNHAPSSGDSKCTQLIEYQIGREHVTAQKRGLSRNRMVPPCTQCLPHFPSFSHQLLHKYKRPCSRRSPILGCRYWLQE